MYFSPHSIVWRTRVSRMAAVWSCHTSPPARAPGGRRTGSRPPPCDPWSRSEPRACALVTGTCRTVNETLKRLLYAIKPPLFIFFLVFVFFFLVYSKEYNIIILKTSNIINYFCQLRALQVHISITQVQLSASCIVTVAHKFKPPHEMNHIVHCIALSTKWLTYQCITVAVCI